MIKKLLIAVVLVVAIASGLGVGYISAVNGIYMVKPGYETKAPTLPEMNGTANVLVFSKTDGFRHIEAIPAANVLFSRLGVEHGWATFFTENAAVHNAGDLAKFDLVIWNNVTGDVLTEDQRAAFKAYVISGGSVLLLHGSGGSREYAWGWYPEHLVGTQFVGHPMSPQFREATVTVEDRTHSSTRHMPETFEHYEEWYSFDKNPRDHVNVLATVDESDYGPENRTLLEDFTGAGELAMGDDHPIIWHHKVGAGTVYFSALGHRGEAYADPKYQTLLDEAAQWLIKERLITEARQ